MNADVLKRFGPKIMAGAATLDHTEVARLEVEAREAGTGVYAKVDNSAMFSADLSSMQTRDEDGIDRVRDPPEKIKPVLATIREKCVVDNIDLEFVLNQQGGDRFGMMASTRFTSTLGTTFPRFLFTEDVYTELVEAYGLGFRNAMNEYTTISLKDFCEDVSKAVDTHPELVPTGLAHTRGATISFKTLAMTRDQLLDM